MEDARCGSGGAQPPVPGRDALLLLLMARAPPRALLPALPGGGAEPAEPGGGSRGGLARSLQRAEAMLRSCVSPGLRRLRSPRPGGPPASDSEDEDGAEATALPARLEQSFEGLRRAFRAWEQPRTETFQGHVLPPPGDAFCYHGVHPRVAERCATLQALLQQRHLLRLARAYGQRLKAASDFVRRLLGGAAAPLGGLCQELRAHAGHWAVLRRRMRGDAWLRPLLLRRHEAVAHMRRALGLLALQAAWLLEQRLEAALRGTARDGAPPALLADLFQGVEIYNRVLGDLLPELGAAGGLPRAFPLQRVLALLAAERGRWAAGRLGELLCGGDGPAVPPAPGGTGDVGPSARSLPEALRALCREDEELIVPVLEVLVASTDNLWLHVLGPPAGSPVSPRPGSAGCKALRWLDAAHAAAAEALHAQYRPLCWGAAGTVLGARLELPCCGTGSNGSAVRELQRALGHARVPPECEEQLGWLCWQLQCQAVLLAWHRDFAHALGSGLCDRCAVPEPSGAAVQSSTARLLQQLFPALGSALRTLPAPPHGGPPSAPCLRLQLLGCCLATAQASCSWLMGKAFQYLASWSLQQFLLVTQGDLQLLKAETDALELLVGAAFPEPGDSAQQLAPHQRLRCHQERWLCQQICCLATSIQLFAGDVLKLFSTDCKRMSAEIFEQTMPLGRHWRLGLRAELPSSPSPYAAAAAQTVLGQVLQGAQLLPRDAQVPTLARVMTAFVEAWMDHILARKIKFSLQGALQLQQDFALVRQLVQAEHYGLAPDIRQSLLSLRALQQMDTAILCLLQQPSSKGYLPAHGWGSLRPCCSNNGVRAQEPAASSLHSLEALEVPGAAAEAPPEAELPPGRLRGGPPEPYLAGSQQQWLSLRLHGARRWRVPGLPCMAKSPEG